MEPGKGADQKFANEPNDTAISVQSLINQGQPCVVKDDHPQHSSEETTDDNDRSEGEMENVDESINKRYASDRQRLLNILPEELWRIVFKKLDSSDEHLERVNNSSPFFRELLLDERKDFLFKNMWKVLGCQKNNKYFSGASKNRQLSGSDGGELEKEILYERNGPTRESRSLRLVCQSWRKGIDKLYENHNLKMKAMADATALLCHFDATHGSTSSTKSPFLCKTITISVDKRGIELAKNGAHALLEKYGQHFSNCSFLVNDLLPSVVSFYSRFRMMLPRMPNLKKLQISYKKMIWLSSEERRVLDTEMVFPTLPGLEELIVNGGTLPLPIFRQLMLLNGHVSISSITTAEGNLVGTFMSRFKSLTVLPCPQNYFEIITANELEWRLTSLCLVLPDCRVAEWPSVFNALKSKFGNTLTHLLLTLPQLATKADGDQILEESKQFKEHFPNLIRLQLEVAVTNPIMPATENLVQPMTDYNRVLTIFAKDAEEWHVKYNKTWGWQQRRDLKPVKVVAENEPLQTGDRVEFKIY